MLHETVYLTNLQIQCPTRNPELNKIAGQLRNAFYAVSLPWSDGNLGRVIPKCDYEEFYGEHEKLRNKFFKVCKSEEKFKVILTTIPFPEGQEKAPEFVSFMLDARFTLRLVMLDEALKKEKRFYGSLLSELKKVIETGFYLKEDISPKLLNRMETAYSSILCYSAEDIRRSTSVREDVINVCGALL